MIIDQHHLCFGGSHDYGSFTLTIRISNRTSVPPSVEEEFQRGAGWGHGNA